MGKWAQQRKRGSAGQSAIPLLPPPAPLLAVEDDQLEQRTTGAGDSGGTITLYYSTTYVGPYAAFEGFFYESPHSWSNTGDLEPGYYKATETGNNSAYAGESPPSAILEL